MDNDVNSAAWTKTSDTAAIFHIFYPDLYEEMVETAQNLGDGCDYYVTIPEEQPELIATVSQQFPKARILHVQNRGRDILPFLEILKRILPLNYDLLIKIHTKKSLHRDDGTLWRQDVYQNLLGNPVIIAKARSAFQHDPRLGILGAEGHVLNVRFYMGGNQKIVDELIARTNLQPIQPLAFPFVASTMFWARPEVFTPLMNANITADEFPEEPLPPDGTLAHAMERFLGLLATDQKFLVKAIDKDGIISEADPLAIYRYAPVPKALAFRNVKKIVHYSAYPQAFAIQYLRITAPYRAAGIELIPGSLDGVPDPERVLLGDAVIFQREFPRNLPLYDQIVARARQSNKLVFYELDDLLFDLPEEHPERIEEAYNAALMPMMAAMTDADVVVVPTDELCKVVEGFNPNVVVLPNYLDDKIWQLKTAVKTSQAEPLTLGYMGSNSHTPDLAMITPVLRKLLGRYQGKLKLEVWGTPLPEGLENLAGVSWHPAPTNVYVDFVRNFLDLKFDVAIAPLADNLFNRCKSGLKYLEYSAIGAAGVFSRLAPYENIVDEGIDGFLAADESEWLEKLILLIEDSGLRRKFVLAAQAKIQEQWLLSKNIQNWGDIQNKLNREFLLEDSNKTLRAHIASTVTRQLYYDRRNINGRNENFTDEIRQLTERNSGLEAEVYKLTQQLSKKEKAAQELRTALRRSEQAIDRIYDGRTWKSVRTFNQAQEKFSRALRKIRTLSGPVGKLFPTKIKENTELLLASGLFDSEYYLKHNPDVRAAGVEPLLHFLNYGGMEGRNPSANFNSNWYLEKNQDVRDAGMNPLLHYLRHGKQEGRSIKAVREAGNQNMVNANQVSAGLKQSRVPGTFLLSTQLQTILEERLEPAFQVALSHDDYTNVTGGTQMRISDEQNEVNHQGSSYLHVYPYNKLETLAREDRLLYLALNLDGKPLGVTESGELIAALKGLNHKQLTIVSIHHSMGFNMQTIQNLLDLAGNKGVFWLHDYFSLCPSYNLRRNDREYCGAPDIDSNSCRLCRYVQQRRLQQPLLERLFENNQLEIASPSQFTYELWQSRTKANAPAQIIPPAELDWQAPGHTRYQSGVLRVGFLGYPLDYKGWDEWMKLVNEAGKSERFRFFQFSSQPGPAGNYLHIETRVTNEDRQAMVEALRMNQIDVAVLWSKVAETFSFTMHEALAAGCFILTNPDSGNIQDTIRRNPERGLILPDFAALLEVFETGAIIENVKKYQKDGRPRADLVFGSIKEIDR